MSRTINRVRNNVTFSPHITNASKRGDIHLSISSSARMRVFKDNFSKIPRNLCQNDKFCQARVNSWNATASGYRYTENPTLATCRDCISKANAWEVFDNTNCVSNGKFRLSKVSIKNLVKWIPTNCEVLINNKGINVIDGLTEIKGEKLDVDVENVRLGIGSDSRIGNKFLHPGCGYGGSCFPKDVKALINMAELVGFDSVVLKAVEERNALQKRVLSERVLAIFGKDLSGLKIAVWGLSFKPGTDDMREASSVVFINEVIASGATVCAYDPEAMAVAKPCFDKALFDQGKLTFVDVQNQALDAADILVVITEWKSFLNLNTDDAKKRMKHAMIIDGRNIYDPVQMREAGFIYSGIGRGKVS